VPAHHGQLTTAFFVQHPARGIPSLFLCLVNASGAVRIVALVHPLTIAPKHASSCFAAHVVIPPVVRPVSGLITIYGHAAVLARSVYFHNPQQQTTAW
jgi:hypothetical protein